MRVNKSATPPPPNMGETTTTKSDAATIDAMSGHEKGGKSRGKGPARRHYLPIPPHRDLGVSLPNFWPDASTYRT